MLLLRLAAALVVAPAMVLGQTGRAGPDFDGIWNSATPTPLERPAQFKDKPYFTKEEAAEWDREFARRNEEPPPGTRQSGTGTYNTVYREFGTRSVRTLRTSIVTDPPDGRIPPLTPAAADIKRRRLEALRKFENPEDLGLQDQCLSFLTAGPPMLPYSYNSNYQIVQTRLGAGTATRSSSTPRTSTMEADSTATRAATLAGTGTFISSSASASWMRTRCSTSSKSITQPHLRGRGKASSRSRGHPSRSSNTRVTKGTTR
jgi:hypothetical protein